MGCIDVSDTHHDHRENATAASFDWASACPEQRDAWAARFVTGQAEVPAFSTDPRADHDLLRHVRETWRVGDLADFAESLWSIYRDRSRREPECIREIGGHDALHVCYHRTGDYAQAAYLATRPINERRAPRS